MPDMCTAPIATMFIKMMNILEIRNISFSYKNGNVFHFPDLAVGEREQVAITGNSGSGKTTFLHLIAGILSPEKGLIIINGTNILQYSHQQKDRFRGENIGLIFQKHFFIDTVSMKDNMLLAQRLPGLAQDIKFVEYLLDELEIGHLAKKFPPQLSQGELQRFSLARSLVNKPVLLLADEPTSSLDDENCGKFVSLITKTSLNHATALLVATHDSRLKKYFNRIVHL